MLEQKSTINYLVVGHVTRDVTPAGYRPGGTVTYSGRLAQALGCRTAVLTSASPHYELDRIFRGIELKVIPSVDDTIFENVYVGNQRVQWLRGRAGELRPADLPPDWRRADIVHLGPLTNEIEPTMIDQFPDSLIGLTPQGWMRRWNDNGRVYATPFVAEEYLLSRATAVVISEEDLLDEEMLERYIAWSRLLVMTQNYAGCTVFYGDRAYQVKAPRIELVEPTGAGDIFAAAFFIRLKQNGGEPIDAAEFANQVAAQSVTCSTLEDKVHAWREADISSISPG